MGAKISSFASLIEPEPLPPICCSPDGAACGAIRGNAVKNPDYATLHPGYGRHSYVSQFSSHFRHFIAATFRLTGCLQNSETSYSVFNIEELLVELYHFAKQFTHRIV